MYNSVHTSFDVMKEFLITGSDLTEKYQFPIIPSCRFDRMPEDTIDFDSSFSRKVKNHRKLCVNFYIDDAKFTRFWNNPDKYLEHLRCFHSVIMPDFSISTGERGMPMPLNIYNKYRNHALAWYLHMNDINVIPSVSIADSDSHEWCFDGLPKRSVLSVCTNGRIKAKASRIEFCDGFNVMRETLDPVCVIVIGKIPEELKTDVKILNFMTRNQKLNEEMKGK